MRRLLGLAYGETFSRGPGYERVRPSPDDPRVYAFARRGTLPDDVALVVLRFDARPATMRIAAPARVGAWRDLLSGAALPVRDGVLDLDVPAWGAAVVVPLTISP